MIPDPSIERFSCISLYLCDENVRGVVYTECAIVIIFISNSLFISTVIYSSTNRILKRNYLLGESIFIHLLYAYVAFEWTPNQTARIKKKVRCYAILHVCIFMSYT